MAIKKKFFGQEDGAVAGESTTLMNARSKWQRSEIMLDIISMLHICVQVCTLAQLLIDPLTRHKS